MQQYDKKPYYEQRSEPPYGNFKDEMGGKQYPRGHRPAEVEYEVHQKAEHKAPEIAFSHDLSPLSSNTSQILHIYNIKKNVRAHYPLGVVLIEECEEARICNFTAQQKACGRKGRRQAPYRSNFPQAHRSMRWRQSLSSRFFPLRLALCRRICPYSSYRIPEALR